MNKFLKPKPYKKSENIPKNIEECFQEMLKFGNLDDFKRLSEQEAVATTHHTVGRWIRNNWGLWEDSILKEYFVSFGIQHPDDMSGLVILFFHRHLNQKPINFDGEVTLIKKHYEKPE
jgi:hypothetical protein